MEMFEWLANSPSILEMKYTGSRIICDPAPTHTDLDILLLVDDMGDIEYGDIYFAPCYYYDGATYEDMTSGAYTFRSYRNGEYNIIVTMNKEFFDNFSKATDEAKRLNLLNKQDRIDLFDKIVGPKAKPVGSKKIKAKSFTSKQYAEFALNMFKEDLFEKWEVK